MRCRGRDREEVESKEGRNEEDDDGEGGKHKPAGELALIVRPA